MTTRRVVRKTKIVATIGPASDPPDVLLAMVEAGLNVARLNFSHGSHAEHGRRLERIREASRKSGTPVATMLDTKGAEVRTGSVENGAVHLEEGRSFALYAEADELGTSGGVSVSYAELAAQVEPDDCILIDDGKLELRVERVEGGVIHTRVVRGGELSNHKGINVPGVDLLLDAMSDANRADLQWAVENEIDYIAASFVRRRSDIEEIRDFLRSLDAEIPIIAKIENAEGLRNLEAIVGAADGTMVARGDLGVELPAHQVPAIQKRIIRTTVGSGKPVITATQMLDSMERNPRPTRAEASDVANAILDGTSAVMLSGETARGRYPVEAVRTMNELALSAEASLREYGYLQQIEPNPTAAITEAISQAAITMASHLRAAAILTLTQSGFTSRQISKYRPDCAILAVTSAPEVARRLCLNWGVTATCFEGRASDQEKVDQAVRWATEQRIVAPGDLVVVTAGISNEAGSTNMVRLVRVPEPGEPS